MISAEARVLEGNQVADAAANDELTVAARYRLVASERYFFNTSVL